MEGDALSPPCQYGSKECRHYGGTLQSGLGPQPNQTNHGLTRMHTDAALQFRSVSIRVHPWLHFLFFIALAGE
jgi:hypothetical protein